MRIEQSAATCEWRYKISMKHICYLNRVHSAVGLSIILLRVRLSYKELMPLMMTASRLHVSAPLP